MYSDYGYSEEKHLGKPYDLKLLRRLYPYTRPYRRLLCISILMVTLITLFEIALPYVTKIAIDQYIVPRTESNTAKEPERQFAVDMDDPMAAAVVHQYPGLFTIKGSSAFIPYDELSGLSKKDLSVLRKDDLNGVAVISVVFLGLILVNFLLNYLQVLIMEYAGRRMMHDLRMRLYRHIQGLSLSFFNRNPVGRLVTRVSNDIDNMYELFTSVIGFVFTDVLLFLGIAGVLISLNFKLAAVSFAVIPLVILASIRFSRQARDIFRILRIKIAEINTWFSESISGIKVIQLFNRERENYQAFERLNHDNYLVGMRQIHVLAVFLPVVELLGLCAIALVVLHGGNKVLDGSLTLGAMVAFISYMRMFFRPIRDVAEKYNILQNAMASAERIFQILDTTSDHPGLLQGSLLKPIYLDRIEGLSLEEVSFSYVPGEMVLKNISFDLRAGKTIAVVGPTGSGKTSLINLILRFYDPIAGRILVNGRDARDYDKASLRARMALVMQDPFLFSSTIRENIFRGKGRVSEAVIGRILEAANCKSLVEHLPDGLDTVLTEGGGSISSGERQLLSIARALAHDPQLILFDEATSYIDSQTEIKIQEAMARLMKHRTALIVAHRLSTVRNADNILVINRGEIIESGPHEALMRRKGFYFKLYRLQNAL
ncbi:MAG: ABC transporter ATP-binding protein [Deltaproteobacteria bacterium]|nr:ABC transporter ATP-binding protein [Deltaproteobacteria bacterium]